ncbi:hypothetical protein [Paraclostridium sordellii]|uniref:hypothetical protein n=1 Tax=Paraclostridium sordellii TaxID=1505 RepID=UPI0022E49C06|nr:hypothetical protein [Paeniclostridium sordellii]
MKHLFLEKVFKYDIKDRKKGDLSGYMYNSKLGYWVNSVMEPCINNANFIKPQTKKEDVETGEDKKGE